MIKNLKGCSYAVLSMLQQKGPLLVECKLEHLILDFLRFPCLRLTTDKCADIYGSMIIPAIFIIAHTWKQPKCPSMWS